MGRGHPECPERLDAIEDRMLTSGLLDVVDRREAPLASTDTLELAHDRERDGVADREIRCGRIHAELDAERFSGFLGTL